MAPYVAAPPSRSIQVFASRKEIVSYEFFSVPDAEKDVITCHCCRWYTQCASIQVTFGRGAKPGFAPPLSKGAGGIWVKALKIPLNPPLLKGDFDRQFFPESLALDSAHITSLITHWY
jgi:hypothetical protein